MNLILQGFAWIFDPVRWVSAPGRPSILVRLAEHLAYSGEALLLAAVIALPIGFAIGHTGRGRTFGVVAANATRALPTLGLLSLFILLLGIGVLPTVLVLAILAVPPLLAGAYAGLESVDRQTIDSARAVGMTEWQILFRVEIPLALPLILGGIRASALQVVATATVAAYFSGGGLGRYLIDGLASHDYIQMVAGSILVTALALVIDGLFALIQRVSVPPGVSGGAVRTKRKSRVRSNRPIASLGIPIQEGN
ncbi:MAG: ABC transporter permease [Lacisediminihabitans sp.]